MKVKKSFEAYFRKLVPDYDSFIEALTSPLKKTIRCNTIKIQSRELKRRLESKGFVLKEIEWYKDGFVVERKAETLGNTLEHFLGYFYVQEKASMLPPLLLDPKPGDRVLDIAASPGSKTSQMAQLMKNRGTIVANDFRHDRINLLKINLQRLGVMNTIVTQHRGESLGKMNLEFDKVLVDAPCTSVGAIRKDFKIMNTWNIKNVKTMARLQKRILEAAINLTKIGGTIVYSTCTLTKEENEDVVSQFLDRVKLVKPKFEFGHRGIGLDKVMRLYPQDIDSEGFFIAKMVRIK